MKWTKLHLLHELRWANTRLPYQLEPCQVCRRHETWRTWQHDPPSTWGCECGDGAGKEWELWLFLAGRGTGKTRTGSAFATRMALERPGSFGCVIAPTHNDLRRIVVDGESGLVRTIDRRMVQLTPEGRVWNQAASEIRFKNGSIIRTLAAEKPDRIRGENLEWVWADELAAWTRLDYAWEQLEMATRIGTPKFLVTTTPRPLPLLKAFVAQPGAVVSTASTFDNPNLSERMRARMRRLYEGTRLGRQELHGEILEEVVGALWTWDMIEQARLLATDLRQPGRTVVGVDPSGGKDEIGIVAAGLFGERGGVLADETMLGSPLQWGQRAVATYERLKADRVVGERNFGGDMVESTIRAADPRVSYKDVSASKGKRQRAEPVAALFEKGWVAMCGSFPELEHEMTNWVPDTGMPSPNRLDAMVWALTELMLQEQTGIDPRFLRAAPDGVGRASPWRG